VGWQSGEDRRDESLPIDVAAGIAVGDQFHHGLVFSFCDKAPLEAGFERCAGAGGHVETFGDEAAAEVFPEEFDTTLKLFDATVVDDVSDKVRIRRAVDRQRLGEDCQGPQQVFPP